MSNKFLLSRDSNSATNPLEEDLDANGHNIQQVDNLCLLSDTGNQICLCAADNTTPSYSICFPDVPGIAGECLELDIDNETLVWTSSPGSGNVSGPAGATDNAICRFDGITGKLIQNSIITISDVGDVNNVLQLNNQTGVPLVINSDQDLTLSASNELNFSGVTNTFTNGALRLRSADLANFYQTITSSNLTADFTWTMPNNNPLQTSFPLISIGGIISYLPSTSVTFNPAIADQNMNGFNIVNVPSVQNTGTMLITSAGQLDISTSDALNIETTGANDLTLTTLGGTGDINLNGNFVRNNGDIDALASGNIGRSIGNLNVVSTTGQVNLVSAAQIQILPGTNLIETIPGFATVSSTGDYTINDVIINTLGIELGPSDHLRFTRNIAGFPQLTLLPPLSIASSYSLNMPSTVGTISAGEFKPMIVDSSNNLSFGADISYVPVLNTPVTAAVNEIVKFTNVTQYTVEIDGSGIDTDGSSNLILPAQLRLTETGGGSDYTGFVAPSSLTSNIMYTMPNADGSADQILSTSGSGQLSWVDNVSPSYIYGFKQVWLGVNSIQFGTSGVNSLAKSSDNLYLFALSGTSTTSFTDVSSSQSESANTSYKIARIGDTTGVNSDRWLWYTDTTVITTLLEFTSGDYDVYREIGWVRNDSGSDILSFIAIGNNSDRKYMFTCDRADTEVLTAGNAGTWTDIDCSAFCIPHVTNLILRYAHGDTGSSVTGGVLAQFRPNGTTSAAGLYEFANGATTATSAFTSAQFEIPTTDHIIEYQIGSTGDELYVFVNGFEYDI